METTNGIRNYAPRPLTTSRVYSGYQCTATLRYEGCTGSECFCYTALTIQNWLCERIRKSGSEVPHELSCPKADAFKEVGASALHSCALPFTEIIAVPESGIWAIIVREPDPTIAARSFVTHAGVRIKMTPKRNSVSSLM